MKRSEIEAEAKKCAAGYFRVASVQQGYELGYLAALQRVREWAATRLMDNGWHFIPPGELERFLTEED